MRQAVVTTFHTSASFAVVTLLAFAWAVGCGDDTGAVAHGGLTGASGGAAAPVAGVAGRAGAGSVAGALAPAAGVAGRAGSSAGASAAGAAGRGDASDSAAASGGGSGAAGDRAGSEQDAGVEDREQPDAAPAFPPFEADGEPLPGTKGAWTYTEFADTQCRDGSPAGVFLNLGTTNKLLLFLEGGGRCADEATCAVFPANIEGGELIRGAASAGVLDRSRSENPVRDWNVAYIPYCTGDRHGGANPDANVPGVGAQRFVGQLNLKKFLNRIVPTFRDSTDVLLTGISAGGFGVAYNSVLVQQAFPKLKIKVIVDSAPFVSTAVFTPCDQERTRVFYKAEQTFLGACGAACPNPNDYWMDYGVFWAKTFADRPIGLISPTEDSIERAFFGIGLDDCKASLDFLNPPISGQMFRADLLAYRSKLAAFPNVATFYPDTDTHTFITFDEFYTVTAGGVRLVDWFAQIVNGVSPGHAGP